MPLPCCDCVCVCVCVVEPVLKFLLENVQQAKVGGASAMALRRVCLVCCKALGAHLPSLLTLVQSADSIPALNNMAVNAVIEGELKRVSFIINNSTIRYDALF